MADVRDEVGALLARYGREAGHYTVLGPDPWLAFFDEDREGFIGFLEGRRVVAAWRSPVCAPGIEVELVARLDRYASNRRKYLLALEVNAATMRAGEALGLSALWTGVESYVDLAHWSLAGGRRQKLRWARNHAAGLGVTWREAHPLERPEDRAALAWVESAWKAARPERRTDSFLRTDYLEIAPLRRYFVSELAGAVTAFVVCTPINATGWYLQDLVRLADAVRGSLEGAVTLALDTLRDEGFETASNGPLPFWRPDEGRQDPRELGVVGRRVLAYFDHQYRFSGINRFRSKLEPDRTEALYVVRSRGVITPGVARSIQRLLNRGG
ncbi:MAG: phosphatidylglycerol lysyltransferase domain-containing protein [Acidimicrobiales bacterium]